MRRIGIPLSSFRFFSCRQRIPFFPPLQQSFTSSTRLYETDEMARKDKDKEKTTFQLKTPKGTRDWQGTDMVLREWIFSTITAVFKRHGAVTIDTPVFELKEILAGKYGEDSKLIYDLADQGGEICSLRYDLTVPFARWLAANPTIQNIKRYHIAKVYRRDQPAMTKGRMREFYQCDIDIAGLYDPMLPDAEILRIIVEVFTALGWKDRFTIKLNHRKVLDGIFKVCGVPDPLIRPISSAVDKLDKLPWAEVRKEMVEKSLDEETSDKIGTYVQLKGSRELLEKLKGDALNAHEDGKKGIAELELLFDYLDAFGVLSSVSFDLSLARGLDYYTGLIYEVVVEESAAPALVEKAATNGEGEVKKERAKKEKKLGVDDDRSDDPTVGVGSVAAGGRYDGLVGMFSGRGQIPCVGISFGVDRIFSVIKKRLEKDPVPLRSSDVDVYVMAMGAGLLKERMTIANELWSAGISAEFSYKVKPKMDRQFKDAEKGKIPLGVILGEEELAKGEVRIKQFGLAEGHAEKNGVLVQKSELVAEIKKRLAGLEDTSLAARLGGMKMG